MTFKRTQRTHDNFLWQESWARLWIIVQRQSRLVTFQSIPTTAHLNNFNIIKLSFVMSKLYGCVFNDSVGLFLPLYNCVWLKFIEQYRYWLLLILLDCSWLSVWEMGGKWFWFGDNMVMWIMAKADGQGVTKTPQ